MDISKIILAEILLRENINVTISLPEKDVVKMFSDLCYKNLCKIKSIVINQEIDEYQCRREITKVLLHLDEDECF